jgi:hypothetical protein
LNCIRSKRDNSNSYQNNHEGEHSTHCSCTPFRIHSEQKGHFAARAAIPFPSENHASFTPDPISNSFKELQDSMSPATERLSTISRWLGRRTIDVGQNAAGTHLSNGMSRRPPQPQALSSPGTDGSGPHRSRYVFLVFGRRDSPRHFVKGPWGGARRFGNGRGRSRRAQEPLCRLVSGATRVAALFYSLIESAELAVLDTGYTEDVPPNIETATARIRA